MRLILGALWPCETKQQLLKRDEVESILLSAWWCMASLSILPLRSLWFTAVLVLGYWWWGYRGRKGNFCFLHSRYIVSISPNHTGYPRYLRTPGILGIVAGITGISVKLPTCQVSPVSPIIPYTISSESLAIPDSASIFASSVFKVLRITMNCESKSNGLHPSIMSQVFFNPI